MLAHQRDDDRRGPFVFQIVCQSAHGSRARGSNRAEDDGIYPVRLEHPRQRACFRLQLIGFHRPHERVVVVGDRADLAIAGADAVSMCGRVDDARAIGGGPELWRVDHEKPALSSLAHSLGPPYGYTLGELAEYLPGDREVHAEASSRAGGGWLLLRRVKRVGGANIARYALYWFLSDFVLRLKATPASHLQRFVG